jgi:3-methylcrotonyl-CoA carboxylase alpha subunit
MVAMGLVESTAETGFVLWRPLNHKAVLSWQGEDFTASVRIEAPDRQRWQVDGTEVVALRVGGTWEIDGMALPPVAVSGARVTVFDRYGLAFEVVDPLARAAGAAGDGNLIEAPMPGLVKWLGADVGQAVAQGDRLAVLEAMKMEHALTATRDGIVAEVLVAAGVQVEAGQPLIRLEEDAP